MIVTRTALVLFGRERGLWTGHRCRLCLSSLSAGALLLALSVLTCSTLGLDFCQPCCFQVLVSTNLEVNQSCLPVWCLPVLSTSLMSTSLMSTSLMSTSLMSSSLMSTSLMSTCLMSSSLMSSSLMSTCLMSSSLMSTSLMSTSLMSTNVGVSSLAVLGCDILLILLS